MADKIRKVSVRIGGMSYQLVSAADEEYTRQIAAAADEMIRRVMQNNPQLSQSMSAILALVNALDDLTRLRHENAGIDDQRQLHDRQLTEARNELSRLREQNWEIKKEVLRLNGLCKDYEALLVQQREQSLSADTEDAACLDDVDAESDTNSDIKPDAFMSTDTEAEPEIRLTQTNLEDYLRANDWPVESVCDDDQP